MLELLESLEPLETRFLFDLCQYAVMRNLMSVVLRASDLARCSIVLFNVGLVDR